MKLGLYTYKVHLANDHIVKRHIDHIRIRTANYQPAVEAEEAYPPDIPHTEPPAPPENVTVTTNTPDATVPGGVHHSTRVHA